MKLIIPFVVVIFFTLFVGCKTPSIALLQSEIDGISSRWVPDESVGICNLTLEKGRGKNVTLKGESLSPEAKTEVLQLLTGKGLSVTDSVLVLPDTIHLEKNWGVISVSVANLRSRSSHSAELVSQAIMGTPVHILKEDDGWLLIQTPDRYIAWTNQSSIHLMSRSEMIEWRNTERIMFTGSYGTVHGDSLQKIVMGDLVAGAIVAKISENSKTLKISLPDGRSGYVSNLNWQNFKQWKDTVTFVPENLIYCGKQFLGFPYMWGGTSSKALDCSGFVETVCFLNGYVFERDASQQMNHGIEVDVSSGWDKLRKGDMLFFGSKQPLRVIHVGMYIGDGEVIHSSGSVRINSLDKLRDNYSNYLTSTLLGARRIAGLLPEQGFLPVKLHNWY